MTFSDPMVVGSTIISTLQSIVINQIFTEDSLPLHLASRVPSDPMGIEVSPEASANQLIDSLPMQHACRSLARLGVSLIVIVDDPYGQLSSPLVVSSNDIISCTSAKIYPLINQLATTPLYCH